MFTSEGRVERKINTQTGAASAVMQTLYPSVVLKGEPKGKVLYLKVYLYSNPHQWSLIVGNDRNEIADVSG